MEFQTIATRPVRFPLAVADRDRRGVRLPVGADGKIFGGWGIRF